MYPSKGGDETINFILKDNKIILDDEVNTSFDIEIYNDSMVITYDSYEKIKTTYKKLPKTRKKINWNPSGNLYKLDFNGQKMYKDFINDSLSYLHFSDEIEVLKYYWRIEHISNYSFLLLESGFGNELLVIDSIVGTKIYLTDHNLDGKNYILEQETNVQKAPTQLLGTWKLANLEDIQGVDDEGVFDPLSKNRIKKIIINKDSIFVINEMFKQKSAWKYYKNGNLILLKDKEKMAKIVELSAHSLLLEMNLSTMGDSFEKKKFIFIRQ